MNSIYLIVENVQYSRARPDGTFVCESLAELDEGTVIASPEFFTDKTQAQLICDEMNGEAATLGSALPYYVQVIHPYEPIDNSQTPERIKQLGKDVTVLLDDRELKYFDFKLDGINGIFRISTRNVTLESGLAAARKWCHNFKEFADADIADGEMFHLSRFFNKEPPWNYRTCVAWYTMPYSGVRSDLQMHNLYKNINTTGVEIIWKGSGQVYFFRYK